MTRLEWTDEQQTTVVVTQQGNFWCPVGTEIASRSAYPVGVIPSPEWEWVEEWVANGGTIESFGTDAEVSKGKAKRDLAASDWDMLRVIDDIYSVLTPEQKAAMPAAAVAKLNKRVVLRGKLSV